MIKLILFNILLTIQSILSSPIVTEEYIEEFKFGIEDLIQSSEDYYHEEKDFDFDSYNESKAIKDQTAYDFIIIGAGAAGSVLANRLTENPRLKVLVLEAGGPETPYTKIPRHDYLLSNTEFNWGFKTVPQKTWCLGMIDNQCAIAAGKALGGSTVINGMLYTRGNPADYDTWAQAGNPGWAFKDVFPYFQKAESANVLFYDPKYRNLSGPFHVENPRFVTPITTHTLAAAQELGLDLVDYNGKKQIGFGLAQLSTKNGTRQSTAEAYLKPASNRGNLKIKPHSQVIKVVISPTTKQATNVLYLHKNKLYAASAQKEIIISAGTFNTPKILMLSGIGPKQQLENLKISVVQDLPVGQFMKNHVGFFGLDFIYQNGTTNNTEKIDEVVDYLKNGRGRLTTNGFETIGYLSRNGLKNDNARPDIEMFFMENTISSDNRFNPLRYKSSIFKSLWEQSENQDAINVGLLLAHPKSTGTFTLKDQDPFHEPLIDANQLSDPNNEDINTLLLGIRNAIKFMDTKAMKALNLKLNHSPVAGCEQNQWNTDDYWKCALRHISTSYRHQTGTAKMGPKTDKQAVVDCELRVHGIKNLRVVDGSVFPVTISGHMMGPVIMLGEKASDMIKNYWK